MYCYDINVSKYNNNNNKTTQTNKLIPIIGYQRLCILPIQPLFYSNEIFLCRAEIEKISFFQINQSTVDPLLTRTTDHALTDNQITGIRQHS